MPLDEYQRKRTFDQTPEPKGAPTRQSRGVALRFVIQKHAARRLHYDLRLEIDGTLKSWAVPRGPSLDPKEKRLAVRTEDHPMEYLDFEAVIPQGNYGAGTMMVWDRGEYSVEGNHTASEQYEGGELKLQLKGKKVRGGFVLVKTKRKPKSATDKSEEWLLIKHRDAHVDPEWDPESHGESVATGRTMAEIADGVPPRAGCDASGPGALEGAMDGPMPENLTPMLAASLPQAFSDPEWLFEIKWDGVRALAAIRNGSVSLASRKGRDLTDRYPDLASIPDSLDADEALIDGEIVVLDESGRSSFERLQSRMHVARPSAAALRAAPAVFYAFDILYCDGYDLRAVPLVERKRFLEQHLHPTASVRFSDHVVEQGQELFDLARQSGAEGIIGKQLHSEYVSTRSNAWVKVKVVREVEAVVVGFTDPQGGREHFGALELALYDEGKLVYIGGVGSGFNQASQAELFERLEPLRVEDCPLGDEPFRPAHWLSPRLVARVKFSEWTHEHRLRHAVFLGLRDDVEAEECVLDIAATTESGQARAAPEVVHAPAVASLPVRKGRAEIEKELLSGKTDTVIAELEGCSIRLTHLNKIYFPELGFTKRRTLGYYWQVADLILPFLKDRPLVLQRHPNGIHGGSFYQKDAGKDFPDWVSTTTIYSEERRGEMPYFMANNLADLLFLSNLGCIEHNPWSSRIDALEQPDYVFFDLDPTEGTGYGTVVEVARHILGWLEKLGLRPFLKTSGKRGFHLYLPLEREYSYEQVRTFAEILARVVAAQMPKQTTLERTVEKRPKGAIYLDYSQNGYGRPLVSVYSLRPVPAASASTPVTANQLRKTLDPSQFNLETLPKRLETTRDLWAEFWHSRQRIEHALEQMQSEVGTLG